MNESPRSVSEWADMLCLVGGGRLALRIPPKANPPFLATARDHLVDAMIADPYASEFRAHVEEIIRAAQKEARR